MIGAWLTTFLKASRSAKAAALIPKMQALGQRTGGKPKLPGTRGKALQLEAITPWPNLAVTKAVVTGSYEMNLKRTPGGQLSAVLQPSMRPVHKTKATITVRPGTRPDALMRIEYGLRRTLTGFFSGKTS
jgi:hypothetical protein